MTKDQVVLLELLDLKDPLAFREWLDHLDPLALQEREAREENVVLLEFKDQMDPVDLLVPSDLQEKLENAEPWEIRVTKDGWDPLVCQEIQDLRDKPEKWDQQDLLELWAEEDAMDPVVHPVKMVKPDLPEFQDNVEFVDHLATMADQEITDPQDHPDLLVTLPATHHSRACKDPKDQTQQKVIMVMRQDPMRLMSLTR